MKTIVSSAVFIRHFISSALLFLALSLQAQVWDGGGVNNNWTTAANWNPDGVPANNGTANISFGGTTRLTPNVDVAQDILSLTFNSGTSVFTIGGTTLTIRSGGITNNASPLFLETINTPIIIPASAAQTWRVGNGLSLGGPTLALGSTVTLTSSLFSSVYIANAISGNGSLVNNGVYLNLSGANTYFGSTTVNNSGGLSRRPTMRSVSTRFSTSRTATFISTLARRNRSQGWQAPPTPA